MPDLATPIYDPAEHGTLFTNEWDHWIVKDATTATKGAALKVAQRFIGPEVTGASAIRCRVEWEQDDWVLHPDEDGPIEAWEVYEA